MTSRIAQKQNRRSRQQAWFLHVLRTGVDYRMRLSLDWLSHSPILRPKAPPEEALMVDALICTGFVRRVVGDFARVHGFA